MNSPPLLLDREFLKTLEDVTLLCRTNLAGTVGPEHRSRARGPGMEFADYRRYTSGDDPRSLDWSAYLRLGKLFLKIYETEQHIPVRILLDRSESMDCETSGESKFLYAQRLAATFAYLALLHLDTAAVIPFADRMNKPLVVSGGRERLWPVLRFLSEQSCGGGTNLFGSVKEFLGNFTSRGIVILISDFFDEQGSRRAVEMLRSAGHDFVLVQVHSAEEQRPTASGELVLQDAETGAQRVVECSPQSTELYERGFLEFSARLRQLALRNGGRYARAVTGIPYQEFVLRSLRSGQVLA
ncbi:MAG TPA: DUF58 domain-containing protein [Candidatus Dormibacteraeota bacterium]|nr:DUF58 domain-containing protein [Candidatus Dormibacteraeota bacterium]